MKGLHPPAEHRARGAPCVTLVLCKLSAEKQMTLTLAWAPGLLISPGTAWECAAGTRGDPLQPPWTQSPVWWCRRVTDGSRSGHDDAPLWGPPTGMGPLCCFLAMISPRYGPAMLCTVLLMGHSQISLRKTHVTTNGTVRSLRKKCSCWATRHTREANNQHTDSHSCATARHKTTEVLHLCLLMTMLSSSFLPPFHFL